MDFRNAAMTVFGLAIELLEFTDIDKIRLLFSDEIDGFSTVSRKSNYFEIYVNPEIEPLFLSLLPSGEDNFRRSLLWLLLHEFQHAELGHFELLDGKPVLHLVSQSRNRMIPLIGIPKPLWHKVEPCLELQADHDAIEIMLGSYSRNGWIDLRTKIASIAAIMVLIEKHDDKHEIEHSTHPKAATRIFQLLGHVTEMWSLPAHAKAKARGETTICEGDLPSDEEKQLFSKEVILPAFWDTVALAEAAKAKSIISDLGSPEDFFADIGRAKLGQCDELVTVGAIEWAKLKDANDLIVPLLPINQETN